MLRVLFVVGGFLLILSSCTTQKMICPAFQSAYIYDQEALRKKFSYFKEDSTPKIFTASKTKYLVATPVSYRKKERGLMTVPMKEVKTVLPDSLQVDHDLEAEDLSTASDSTAVLPADSTSAESVDSTYMITVDREIKFIRYDPIKRQYQINQVGLNTDEDNYLWYLRDVLVLPDVRLANLKENEGREKTPASGGASPQQRKGIGGFFQKLFGGSKAQPDTVASEVPAANAGEKPKKGLFSGKKRQEAAAPGEDENVPMKEEDDGF